jgi:hypothetical protein
MFFVFQSLGQRTHFTPPADTDLIEVGSHTEITHPLNIKGEPLGNIYYEMTGRYTVKDRTIQGTVESGLLEIDKDLKMITPMHFQSLQVLVCYVDRSQGNEYLNAFPNAFMPQWTNSMRIDADGSPGLKQSLPGFKFKLIVPNEVHSTKFWLCGALAHSGGGYFPGHQISAQMDIAPKKSR